MKNNPLDSLIEKYENRIKAIVNPDGIKTWEEAGYDEKPDRFDTIEEVLFAETEFDEGDQVEISVCKDIVEDLKKLQKNMG